MKLTVVMIGQSFPLDVEGFDEIKTLVCENIDELPTTLAEIHERDGWITVMHPMDRVGAGYWKKITRFLNENPDAKMFFMPKKYIQCNKVTPFSYSKEILSVQLSKETIACLHSFFMEGTFVSCELLEDIKKYITYQDLAITLFLLDAQEKAASRGDLFYLSSEEVYEVYTPHEGDKIFFSGVYNKDWYLKMADILCLPFFKEKISSGSSLIWQYHAAFLANFCIEANLNNLNKHLFEGDEAEDYLWKLGEILSCIQPRVILDKKGLAIDGKNDNLRRWVYLILKHRDKSLEYSISRKGDKYYYGYDGIKAGLLSEATVDIQNMKYENDILHIDGRISPILFMNNSRVYIQNGKNQTDIALNERYAHTKAFGVSVYKLKAFHADVSIKSGSSVSLAIIAEGEWGKTEATLEFDSHFSRITNSFHHSYWRMDKRTMMTVHDDTQLQITPIHGISFMGQEIMLWLDMLKTGKKKVIKYIPVRIVLLLKPLFKRKPIWLFFDKIYKGGDSSEYLYHYTKKQGEDIRAYYLLDEKSPDYARFIKEGDKPLKRHSLAHRITFLYADWVIISNSTLFAFNDMSTKNSAYIRDLVYFHVACVQHGMSVQKIAVAQNRLRDNIELYFCASKYEIKNLSKPVYDYAGYDCLKLTGVPRFDGLVNRDKKQILISPTWRMQVAVPVTKNEGVERDYNPLFKETSYYKVYNSLINDDRLISAAKRCGYSIVYVLHPIVSAQAEDFDTNDYVKIIPATGDMSYEKVFCESSLMVTDFSGVQFDFAYMKKPVLYLHHRDIPKHYENGEFFYDTMGFGEICHDNDELIDMLIQYMAGGCKIKEEYRNRVEDFFEFSDQNNCKRIYEIITERQNMYLKQ